jgi:hypothetical protein
MWKSLKQLDQVLRGEATRLPALREQKIEIPAGGLFLVIVVLGLFYGACMGCYAVFRPEEPSYMQIVASIVKVPALFLLTLAVTFPSLYVFNALVGSQLRVLSVLRLLIAALAVNLAVLASLGTIVAFFSVCTESYAFMVLLNVAVFAVSGVLGLTFLLQTLHRLSIAGREPQIPAVPVEAAQSPQPPPLPGESPSPQVPVAQVAEEPGPLDRTVGHVLGRHVKAVFTCWVVVFGLVGAQMGWVLRPFVGAPSVEFQWLRARESSFFEAVWRAAQALFS